MSGVIRWEEPPPPTRGPRKAAPKEDPHGPVAAELRNRPGEWAVVYEGPNGTAAPLATNIVRAGIYAFSPPGAYEAVCRKVDGVSTTFARYVGEA